MDRARRLGRSRRKGALTDQAKARACRNCRKHRYRQPFKRVARVWRGGLRIDRSRRSRHPRLGARPDHPRRYVAAPSCIPAARQEAQLADEHHSRAASSCADAGRSRGVACCCSVRRPGHQCRRLHPLPLMCIGLSNGRAFRQRTAASPVFFRERVRAVRPLRRDLPGEGHHIDAAGGFSGMARSSPARGTCAQ